MAALFLGEEVLLSGVLFLSLTCLTFLVGCELGSGARTLLLPPPKLPKRDQLTPVPAMVDGG